MGADIKLGSLLSGNAANYNLTPAFGFGTGVVAIGLNHTGSGYVSGPLTGHMIELDFHVVQTSAPGNTTLLDLQTIFVDANGNSHIMNIHDKNNTTYTLATVPNQYQDVSGNAFPLTQAGALQPSTFSPPDNDTTDAAIQVVAGSPSLTPTAVADSFNMAPNNVNFTTTMTATGPVGGVLANDTATANGPMNAVLSGGGITTTVVAPVNVGVNSATEVGQVVTITTSSATALVPGDGVTITNMANSGYNGYFPVATVISNTQFTYIDTLTNLSASNGGTVSSAATTVYSANTPNGKVWLNALDGSFAYTPATNFVGTDTFTYKAVDATSTTASASATVTITVGGYLSIPQFNLRPVGGQVVVPVNILSGGPANSGGLNGATIGINYDSTLFSVAGVSKGSLIPNSPGVNNWSFAANTATAGKIVITTSAIGIAAPWCQRPAVRSR